MVATARKAGRHLTEIEDLVKLDPDHPGFRDPVYRARRNEIARLALAYRVGDPIPRIDYTDEEHAVWRAVRERLEPVHARYACAAYRRSAGALALDPRRIPQLADATARLEALTGFRMLPVAGLVSSRMFLGNLANGVFLSTQYIRHASRPLYTPEPDIVHELIGHACTLYDRELAALNRLFGGAALRARRSKIRALERLYWYTVEFGLLEERGRPKAYGAGLLSSFGELERFEASASVSPFDPDECAARPYDPTDYQGVLYVVPNLEALARALRRWFARNL
jgi:phenylalanine-4-hydroxylase